MEYPCLKYEVKDRVALVTLNRPEKKNALNPELINSLKAAFNAAGSDHQVKIIILKASGDVFCAGADLEYLRQLQQNSFEDNLADSSNLMELFRQIYFHDKIIIAQVEGAAIAGGCGLATVCDFCYSVPEAHFGYTEVKIGFVPALVSTFLIRKVGETAARELLLTGKLISAERAVAAGLINKVILKSEITDYVWNTAQRIIVSSSAASIQLTKKAIAAVQSMPLEEALNFAASLNAQARSGEDYKKGIAAFIHKQKLTW
jgi:methylglutaconyl-CoA hydratase